MGNINTSTITYCDDFNILSLSVKQLQILLDVCDKYGKDWKIQFSPEKSNLIREASFGKP